MGSLGKTMKSLISIPGLSLSHEAVESNTLRSRTPVACILMFIGETQFVWQNLANQIKDPAHLAMCLPQFKPAAMTKSGWPMAFCCFWKASKSRQQ